MSAALRGNYMRCCYAPRSMTRATFELSFGVTVRCVRCRASRDLDDIEGHKILSADHETGGTVIVRAETGCSCGEKRVKVEFAIG